MQPLVQISSHVKNVLCQEIFPRKNDKKPTLERRNLSWDKFVSSGAGTGQSLGFWGVLAVLFSLFEEGKRLPRGLGGVEKRGADVATPPWHNPGSSPSLGFPHQFKAGHSHWEGSGGSWKGRRECFVGFWCRSVAFPLLQEQEESLGCALSPLNSSLAIHEPKSSGFPRSQVEFHRDFSSRNPRMLLLALGERVVAAFCRSSPASAPVGCSWQGSGNAAGWERGAGGKLCPRREQNVPAQLPAVPTLPLRVGRCHRFGRFGVFPSGSRW